MFMEPYAFCPFCGYELEENGDPQWKTTFVAEQGLTQYAEIKADCVNCNRRWNVTLGSPDEPSSKNCEVLSASLTM